MAEGDLCLVRRGRRNSSYTAISNIIIDHPTLSPAARVALIYLLSKPDDWQLQIGDIRRLLGSGDQACGRNKAYEVIRELKGSAYVVAHEELRQGRFYRLTYYVFDEPVGDPEAFRRSLSQNEAGNGDDDNLPETPDFLPRPRIGETVNQPRPGIRETASPPCPEKRDPVKRHITKDRKKQITEFPPPSPRSTVRKRESGRQVPAVSFSDLWADWPADERPTNQRLAENLFEQLSSGDRQASVELASAYRSAQRHRRSRPLMIPFLRQRLFEEFQSGPEYTPEGYFRILPAHAEWNAWKAELRRTVSEASWAKQEKLGFLLTRSRTPQRLRTLGAAR